MKKISIAALAASTAAIAFASGAAAAPKVDPVFTGVGVKLSGELPRKANSGGAKSLYPFDKLTEVGSAFGLKNKTASKIASVITNANRKGTEAVLDAAGNATFETKPLKQQDGSVTDVPDTTKPIRKTVKHFYAIDVDAELAKRIKDTDLEGSTVLVIRNI